MFSGLFVGVWGAITVVHLALTVFCIVKLQRTGSASQLQSDVRQLAIDVEELYNAVEKWTKRRYASEAREKIGKVTTMEPPERGSKAYKDFLRLKQRGGVQ